MIQPANDLISVIQDPPNKSAGQIPKFMQITRKNRKMNSRFTFKSTFSRFLLLNFDVILPKEKKVSKTIYWAELNMLQKVNCWSMMSRLIGTKVEWKKLLIY